MEDRELLELAARAVGIRLEWDGHPDQWQPMYYEGKTYHSFDPLEDDGDALRLAVKLKIVVYAGSDYGASAAIGDGGKLKPLAFEGYPFAADENRKAAATRRAIVRAAAEIGRSATLEAEEE